MWTRSFVWVKDNSVMSVRCGKQIHSRCAGLKRVMQKKFGVFACMKY